MALRALGWRAFVLAAVVALIVIALPIAAIAHSGRTDANGGHNDYIHGGYHYHNGGSVSGGSGGGGYSSGASYASTSSSGSCWPLWIVGGVIGLVWLGNKK